MTFCTGKVYSINLDIWLPDNQASGFLLVILQDFERFNWKYHATQYVYKERYASIQDVNTK